MALVLSKGVHIVAPGPGGHRASVTDAQTGIGMREVVDIKIHIPVDAPVTAEITCYAGAVDVIAQAEFKFIAPCPECGHGRDVT